jgi:phosphoenolpyruvate carboxykinase (diphosphate)
LRAPFPCPGCRRGRFVLDEPGLARELSLPLGGDYFESPLLRSYRLRNGVLHNPANDRRTTQGVFHIAEGGLPIPDDKLAVPRRAFVRLLERALLPPPELLRLPFTAGGADEAACFASLLLRPLVVPAVPGFTGEKRMEIRFFAPGSLVSNLDFVESIFGNAGDPRLPENDAALDPAGWTGHTGCVILAPHLTAVTKRELGLPEPRRGHRAAAARRHVLEAARRALQRRLRVQGVRARRGGVIVTIIADNYYGYCKKEVKTQISYSANLFGLAEEEHCGGALVYPAYDLGEEFSGNLHVQQRGHSFAEVAERYTALMEPRPEGYAVDREYPDIIYVPEDVAFDLNRQELSWVKRGRQEEPPVPRGPHLRAALGLQGEPRAAAGHRLAHRRDGRRGRPLPQALHGLRRRQVGDIEGDLGRDPARPDLRRRIRARHGPRRRAGRARLLRPVPRPRPPGLGHGGRSSAPSARWAR